MKYPPYLGKSILNLMKLTFETEGSGQSRAPSRSQAGPSQSRASHSQGQEAQSRHTTPMPTLTYDFDQRVKNIVDSALAAFSDRLEVEIGKLVQEVKTGHNLMVDAQDSMKEQINGLAEQSGKLKDQIEGTKNELSDQVTDLEAKMSTQLISQITLGDKVEKILKHLGIGSSTGFGSTAGPSSSHPKPDPEPNSSSPSFTFGSPDIDIHSSPITPSTEVLHQTPSTEILQLSPSTEIIPWQPSYPSPPPTPLIDPLQDPSTSIPFTFEDDKGGEKLD